MLDNIGKDDILCMLKNRFIKLLTGSHVSAIIEYLS